MLDKRKFYINGQWVDALSGTDLNVINPSTQEAVATISLGGQADTDAAVAAAKAAFAAYSKTSLAERIALVEAVAAEYDRRAEDMSRAISLEMGAPIDLARNSQTPCGPWHFDGFLAAAKNWSLVQKLGDQAPNDRIIYEPIGVCALITPWNWPMNQVVLKAAPALLAGCTMVLKPSEIAPLSSLIFAEIMDAAGVPAGVFNLVNGDGVGVGTQLSSHRDVAMVSFTGSSRAGAAISKNAADTFKRVSLELGGKGPNLIFADADDKAVIRGARHVFQNSGQSCNAPTRMLVERSRYDEAVKQALEVAKSTKVAPAAQEGRHIGPVVSQAQFDKIQDLIQAGLDEGGTLLAGGLGRPEGLNKGYFVRPTIFADLENGATINQTEIFGPVFTIQPFDTEEEAVQIANDTAYGLTAYVQTSDGARRNRLARALNSGMVEMNGVGRGLGSPFGGVKASGNGREGGIWGIEEFCEVKAVSDWDGSQS